MIKANFFDSDKKDKFKVKLENEIDYLILRRFNKNNNQATIWLSELINCFSEPEFSYLDKINKIIDFIQQYSQTNNDWNITINQNHNKTNHISYEEFGCLIFSQKNTLSVFESNLKVLDKTLNDQKHVLVDFIFKIIKTKLNSKTHIVKATFKDDNIYGTINGIYCNLEGVLGESLIKAVADFFYNEGFLCKIEPHIGKYCESPLEGYYDVTIKLRN